MTTRFAQAERLNDHGKKQAWIVDGGESDKMNSSREAISDGGGDFDAKARLTDSTGASDGQQANVGAEQKFCRGVDFFFAAHESCALYWNIGLAGFRVPKSFFSKAVADGGEFVGEIARGGVAFLGFLCKAAVDRPAERGGRIGDERGERIGLFAQNRYESLSSGVAAECALSAEHFVDNQSQRKLIGTEIEREAGGLFGRHIFRRAQDYARARVGIGARVEL